MTDPARIPEHVVEAAGFAYQEGAVGKGPFEENMRHAIAAALDALMGDEPVEVRDDQFLDGTMAGGAVYVRPSDVLAAVLERQR